jgi:hypothetical protein
MYTTKGYEMMMKCYAKSSVGRVIVKKYRCYLDNNGKPYLRHRMMPQKVMKIRDEVLSWDKTHKEPYWCPKRKGE